MFEAKLAYYLASRKRHPGWIQSTQPIYFDPTVWLPSTEEIVVDGGAFIGDTLAAFRSSTGDRFRGYIAFEPGHRQFPAARKAAEGDARIEVVEAGLGAGRRGHGS